MLAKEVYSSLLDKCNKLSTNFGDKIESHTAVRAIKEASNYWYDKRLKTQEVDLTIQRELQHLIKTKKLSILENNESYNSYELPIDYYHLNQIKCVATNSCNSLLDVFFTENNNINEFLLNDDYAPDISWQQTLATVKDNKLFVYKKDFDFTIELDYYKKLNEFDLESKHKHLDGSVTKDVDLEFDNSSAFEIITIAAQLITGVLLDPTYPVHNNTEQKYN